MKHLIVAGALIGTLAVPGLARADASTDTALGLGAFAVLNQIISGTGIFGQPTVVHAPESPPVVDAPAPAVVYAPAHGYYAPYGYYRDWRDHDYGYGRHRHDHHGYWGHRHHWRHWHRYHHGHHGYHGHHGD